MSETFSAAQAASYVRDAEWHVYRRQKWTYKFTSRTLVRYIECAPMREEVAAALIDYLTSADCAQTLTLEHKALSGEWTPITAWYDSDEQHPDRATGLPRVRLYHAMRLGPEQESGDGPYIVENGCAWKVSFTFYWSQPAAPSSLPESSSGVNYRYTSVQRHDETGLWSYILEKRERVQQDVLEFNRVDNALETVKEEQHLGVKEGSELDGYKAAAGVANDGTVTEVDIRKNDDCTSDAVLRKRKRKSGVTGESCQKDIFRHEHTTVSAAASAPEQQDVQEPANGVSHHRSIEKREDGKYDIRSTDTTERAVLDAESIVEQDLFQTVTEIEDSGQPAVENEPSAEGGTNGVVKRKSVRKTPGDLRIKRTRTVMERAVSAAEKTVTQDLYSKRTETTDQSQNPSEGEPSAEGGTNGLVVSKTVTKTRGDKRNKRRVETEERAVSAAEKTVSETAFETVTETTDRNQGTAAVQTGLSAGVRVTNRKTPGGLNDHITRQTSEKSDVAAGGMKKKDLYGTDERTDTRGVAADGRNTDIAAGGTGGKSIRADYRKTDGGKFVKELTVHQESNVQAAKTLNTGDVNSTTVESQEYAASAAPTVVAFAQGKIRIYRTEKTPGGKYVVVETTETATAPASQTLSWQDSGGTYELRIYWNQTAIPAVMPANVVTYDGKMFVQPHFTRNRFGLYDGSVLIHFQPANSPWKPNHAQWWPSDFQKTGLTRKFVTLVRYDDQWYKRVKTVTYTYGYNDDIAHGDSSTSNKGLEEFVSGGFEGSKVQPYGPGAYYWKVTNIAIVDTAVNSPVNTSEQA